MMLLVEGNNVGAQDLAIDLSIDDVIFHCGKNPPLCHLDCIVWSRPNADALLWPNMPYPELS